MKLQKMFDLSNPFIEYDINKYIANGWYIVDKGLTYITLEKIIEDSKPE